jgi:hypothetical protein
MGAKQSRERLTLYSPISETMSARRSGIQAIADARDAYTARISNQLIR